MSYVAPNYKQCLCISGIMFLTRSEYDRGVNTFSPEGRLFQVSPPCVRLCLVKVVLASAVELGAVPGLSNEILANRRLFVRGTFRDRTATSLRVAMV